MRVSDTERQRTIEELRRHCAAGRLDVDEYSSRIETALSATTLEELDQILADLPLMRIADPAGSSTNDAGSSGYSVGRGFSARLGTRGAASADASAIVRRVAASAVVLASVMVVVVGVILVLVIGWGWAITLVATLVAGWLAGLAQGRISRSRYRG